MPYAVSATINHEFDTDHLNIWLTFRHPMDLSLMPSYTLWLLEVDTLSLDIVNSAWQDSWTLLLTSDSIAANPNRVTLAYAGPNSDLQTVWGKDWEPWGPILSTDLIAYTRPAFFDRGDPAAWDFQIGDFITDATYRDLDLSGIVPIDAKAVVLSCRIRNNASGQQFIFRPNGLVNSFTAERLYTQAAAVYIGYVFIIALDVGRVIEYYGVNTTWTVIDVCVVGWFF